MTNERITDIDIDANADLDELLKLASDHDLITDEIDYFLDDAHAAPDCYLINSPTFMTANFPTITDPTTLDDMTFYDRFNNDQMIITFRMITESIAHEIANPSTDD